MSNPGNDNRLEQLSREAANGYTPPGNASWEKMEAALNQVMPVEEKKRRRFIFWWIFPILIAGAGLFYMVMPNNDEAIGKQRSTPITKENPVTTINEKNTGRDENTNSREPIATVSPNHTTVDIVTAPSQLNNNQVQKHNTVKEKSIRIPASKNNTTAPSVTAKLQNNTDVVQKTITEESKSGNQLTNTETVKNNTGKNSTTTGDQQQGFIIRPTADSGNIKTGDGIIEKVTDRIDSTNNDTLATANPIAPTKKTADGKFSIAFTAGMDASTVKYKYSDKAGINIGILAGYHFNHHWSIHTGVLYTKKNYTVAGEDFTAPKGSWVANYKLSLVDGYCNMWEVPLLVRYQFNKNNKRSFFLSAGLSSYFMTRENYNYSYYWNGQPVTRNSNYTDGNTHLLSILRLSGGWKKDIGSRTSLLVEPYAALPLGGVGYGSIRLSSFGLNFSLQLRQPAKKK